jgi:tetratricopeptide (TPR) repeat protein
VGFGLGVAVADWNAPWAWGYWPYTNPYCTAPVVIGGTTINYDEPIVLETSAASGSSENTASQDTTGANSFAYQANTFLDSARDSFIQNDYPKALDQCDRAIALLPNNTVAHEFRGLVLFALQRYKEAAAPIYAVLSMGPGWDWTTLSGFYPDVDVYATQLRDLEKYVNANPNVAEARFLLAYQYMTCGHNDAAAAQFKAAVMLNPKDTLSAEILAALTTSDKAQTASTDAPKDASKEATPSTPAKPVEASELVGNWKMTRSDGSTITLNLTKDSKYSVADGLLVLKKDNTPVMVGEVKLLNDKSFNFKMPGDNPADPGLTFQM